MSANLFVRQTITPIDSSGRPVPNAIYTFYISGTVNLANIYADSALSAPLSNPLTADSAGAFPAIWLDSDIIYRSILTTSGGSLIEDYDLYPASPGFSAAAVGQALFRRTVGEMAAGVVPSDYSYKAFDARRYGIACDGVTDDTSAWLGVTQAPWINYAQLTIPDGLTTIISDTITFPGPYLSLNQAATSRIKYVGLYDRPAVVIGSDTQNIGQSEFSLSVTTPVGNNWAGNSIGVQIRGAFNGNRVRFNYLQGFTIGVQAYCTNDIGMAYNTFDMGVFFDCRYNFNVRGVSSNGFFNSNTVIGGNFQVSSGGGLTTTTSRYGYIFDAEVGGYAGHNNNVFLNPCFQLAQSGITSNAGAFFFNNAGSNNRCIGARLEGCNGPAVYVVANTTVVRDNHIDFITISGGAGTIVDLLSESDGGFSYGNRISRNGITYSTQWSSGDLLDKAWAPVASNISVKGMFFQASGSAAETAIGTGLIGKNYIILTKPQAIGVYIDTSYYKNFEVRADTLFGSSGRMGLTAFDSSGVQISSTRAVQFGGMVEAATYGTKLYGQSADGTGQLNFRVDDAVKSVKILFRSGTNEAYLKAFTVIGFAGKAIDVSNSVSPTTQLGMNVFGGPFAPRDLLSTTIPTALGAGFTERGLICLNKAAAAGTSTPMGWICTLGGWNAPAWSSGGTYLVDQMASKTGNVYFATIVSGVAGVSGPSGTGAGDIVDGGVTWRYAGTYAPVGANATWTVLGNIP